MTGDEQTILRELETSVLFAPDFPRRINVTFDEAQALSPVEKERQQQPQHDAIAQARSEFRRLQDLVSGLGKTRYVPAIPTLARLWHECALVPVRIAAGHALLAIGTEEAWQALEAMIDDGDDLSRRLAVKAVFERDLPGAYAYFEPRFRSTKKGARMIAHDALVLFAPQGLRFAEGRRIPTWRHDSAPAWLRQDPRWLDLAARLRRDGFFGATARAVLRNADLHDCHAALARARASEPPSRIESRTGRDGSFLARYRSGDFVGVWREIGSHPHIGGEFREEALEVARETMRRVSGNVEIISERLRAAGWKALSGELRTAPAPTDPEILRQIEEITGSPVPPSLQAFWEIVGGVDWVWNYNLAEPRPALGVDLPIEELDPLYVEAGGRLAYLFEEWRDQQRQRDPDLVDPFRLDLAPDHYHKANISGGAPYGVELPYFGADPLFANERHQAPFVDYLRLSFRWAGFPGLDQHGDRDEVRRFVETFGAGLSPF
jgi:hypothetical protein